MLKAKVSLMGKDKKSLELMRVAIIDLFSHIPQATTNNKGNEYVVFGKIPIKWNKLEVMR